MARMAIGRIIVQGDNLQFLKTCYMNQDPLIKDKVKGKVKLIYIDPPFATEGDFATSDGIESYSDKIHQSEYLESLRERLTYLRELLDINASIFVHLDWKMGHYVKVIMDSVFDKKDFRNEIIWYYTNKIPDTRKRQFTNSTDYILFYTKGRKNYFEHLETMRDTPIRVSKMKKINGKKIYVKGEDGKGIYITRNTRTMDNVWSIPLLHAQAEIVGYPTQKPEELLRRIIECCTGSKDLVLDVFAGSGTTAAVAEKLGRRWIMCDFGKHAIYTMQKRILNIAESKNIGSTAKKNEKYGKLAKPFCIVSAGAYDFSRIMNLRKNRDVYISFVLGLFSIMRDDVDYSKKYKLPNIYAEKEGNPVEIFPVWDDEYLKNVRIDEEYLQEIITASSSKLKGDYYIIVPETCTVVGDTTLKNSNKENVDFKLLKFPYKVLEDVSRQFQIEEQPSAQADINKLISSAGFYFNEDVEVVTERLKGGFKITKFETSILNKNKERFKGLEGLSIILIDKDNDGKVFDMDTAVYAKDVAKDGTMDVEGLGKRSYLIAIDKHGNESKIIKIG